jgi:uncharacterized protein involved in exopolysaccharide biosynthesis
MRLLETFFRRWYLFVVPVIILGVVGFLSISGTKSKFESSGTFNVEGSTVLSNISGSGSNQNFGYDTPAGATSKQINSTLQTDQFVKDIAARAGLDKALADGTITTQWIRSSLTAASNGSNLVTVIALNEDAQVAQRLAQATIDAYVQSIVDSASSQSAAAVAFFGDQTKTFQTDLDNAQNALNDFVAGHPVAANGQRPEDQQAQIGQLTNAVTQAQNNYNTAVSKGQDAQLSLEQTKADVGQQLRLIDAPAVPVAPQPKLKKMIFSFGTFLGLGLVLTLAALVVATLLNHTILSPLDVTERLGGVRLLAVLPDGSGRAMRAVKVAKVKAPKPKAVSRPASVSRAANASGRAVKSVPDRGRRGSPASGGPAPKGPNRGRTATGRPIGRASGGSGWPG